MDWITKPPVPLTGLLAASSARNCVATAALTEVSVTVMTLFSPLPRASAAGSAAKIAAALSERSYKVFAAVAGAASSRVASSSDTASLTVIFVAAFRTASAASAICAAVPVSSYDTEPARASIKAACATFAALLGFSIAMLSVAPTTRPARSAEVPATTSRVATLAVSRR